MVLTANGEVHTNDEAQVYVHDLDLFVTVQSLAETVAVPSLGKLCEDHGNSNEWVSGQKPRWTKEGKTIVCKTDNFVLLVEHPTEHPCFCFQTALHHKTIRSGTTTCTTISPPNVATYVRAGALVPPPPCLVGGATRVVPGQYPQYTRADFGEGGCG